MSVPVWIPRRYESRYSLLGAMAAELSEAFAARGYDAREDMPDGSVAGIYIFFNMPSAIEAIPPAVRRPGARVALIQILVDHPFCTHEARSQRAHDVVVAGSIHSEQGVRELKWALPAQAHPWLDEIVSLMLESPAMPYEQALDCVCGSRSVITGNWPMAAAMWRAVAADFNRQRRIQLVQSLQGLDVAVFGSDAWEEICTGSIKYTGNVEYADVPAALATGRVCLAWGPTQFPQTFSERLLLSMASGCASVCEDRYLVQQHFTPEHCAGFDPQQSDSARKTIESLLNDRSRLHSMSVAGRTIAESNHLWEHRVDKLASLASEALSRPLAPAPTQNQSQSQSVPAGA